MQLAFALRLSATAVAVASLLISAAQCWADAREPRMGIFTKPNARIDLSLQVTDSTGGKGTLSSMMVLQKPMILVPIFYRCPRLCGLTISGGVDLVNRLPLKLGRDYSVVAYSFSPDDTVQDAAEKRAKVIERIVPRPTADAAVRFLIADAPTVTRLNEQLGFRVRFADKELEHSSAIFVVSSQGKVQRYFAGTEFNPSAVDRSLRE